jgi:hypothetical protein
LLQRTNILEKQHAQKIASSIGKEIQIKLLNNVLIHIDELSKRQYRIRVGLAVRYHDFLHYLIEELINIM